MTLVELALAMAFGYFLWRGIQTDEWSMLAFHAMLFLGFSLVALFSIFPLKL